MCPADQSFAGGDYVQEEQISVGHWVTTAGHCPMFGVYFPAYTGTQTHTLTDTDTYRHTQTHTYTLIHTLGRTRGYTDEYFRDLIVA